MKANQWMGKRSVEVHDVPDPEILNPSDAIVKVSSTAICGSDLHLYNGFVPTMKSGDVLGHEFMGEVMEVGRGVKNLKVGDRVVVPFPIACGACAMCGKGLFSLCENSNPNAWMAEKLWGYSPAGLFGYSHMLGGFPGGQAEYVRVPFADVGPLKIPAGIPDEKVLFLSDILPTGYMGAEMCSIAPGDVIAVWGAGPVGQFAIKSAYLLGAERVIAIDRFPYRLRLAREASGAETLNYERVDIDEALRELTGGRGPDACIDAVGMEAHAQGRSTPMIGRSRRWGSRRIGRSHCGRRFTPAATAGRCRSSACTAASSTSSRWARYEPLAHDPDWPVSRAAVHEAAARANRAGRDRSELRHHPPAAAARRAGGV